MPAFKLCSDETSNNCAFKIGEVVFARTAPSIKLIIRRYTDRIYYCKYKSDQAEKDLVYFERELTSAGRYVYV